MGCVASLVDKIKKLPTDCRFKLRMDLIHQYHGITLEQCM